MTQKKELKEARVVDVPQDGCCGREKNPIIWVDASENNNSTAPVKGYPANPLVGSHSQPDAPDFRGC